MKIEVGRKIKISDLKNENILVVEKTYYLDNDYTNYHLNGLVFEKGKRYVRIKRYGEISDCLKPSDLNGYWEDKVALFEEAEEFDKLVRQIKEIMKIKNRKERKEKIEDFVNKVMITYF